MVPKGKSGCYDVRTLNAARTYDAENHMLKTSSYSPAGYVSDYETLCWGANGKVRSDFQSALGKTYTLHWDGDELLFVTDQGGALIQLDVERLGSVTMTGGRSFIVSDRDMSGVEASARGVGHVAGSAPAWESGWNVLSGGGVVAGKNSIPKITDGTTSGTAPSAYLMYDSARTDGYMIAGVAVQGVRAFDPGTQQWTAPDAYKGDVDDPMSQRSYMWNDNNPISYSDPSGYEAVLPGVAGAEVGGRAGLG